MRLLAPVAVVMLVLAPLAAIALRKPRSAVARPSGRLVLERLAVLAVFILVVIVAVALRS
jgi:hypothetical protein